jgi:hypothetical protein
MSIGLSFGIDSWLIKSALYVRLLSGLFNIGLYFW